MEAASGFEPENNGFAGRRLTTWPSRLVVWSGKRDLNPRLRPWQGRTLPLSYSRSANKRNLYMPSPFLSISNLNCQKFSGFYKTIQTRPHGKQQRTVQEKLATPVKINANICIVYGQWNKSGNLNSGYPFFLFQSARNASIPLSVM